MQYYVIKVVMDDPKRLIWRVGIHPYTTLGDVPLEPSYRLFFYDPFGTPNQWRLATVISYYPACKLEDVLSPTLMDKLAVVRLAPPRVGIPGVGYWSKRDENDVYFLTEDDR